MDILQLPGQIELLCDVINKNASSFPVQDFSPDQVPLLFRTLIAVQHKHIKPRFLQP